MANIYTVELDKLNASLEQIKDKMNQSFKNAEVVNLKTNEQGKISSILSIDISSNNDIHTYAVIKYLKCSKEYALDILINKQLITFVDTNNFELFTNYYDEINQIKAEVVKIRLEQRNFEIEEEQKRREEAKQQKEIEKAKLRAENRVASQLKLTESLVKNNHNKTYSGSDYYYAIGWLAKHAKNFIAAMPDYLESWFIKQFGDVPHRAVDQKTLSPSGLPSQYALYFKIDVDTNENMPSYLKSHLGDVKKEIKPISDTQFIFDIMTNEKFVFGKAKDQDLVAITQSIPTEYLIDFHAGFAS